MSKRGAIPKLTPEVTSAIVASLEAGNTRSCAAYSAGISPRTLANWMARGRKGEEEFVAFVASVKQAERKAEAELVGNIREASKRNWQAAAWLLERRNQLDWATNAKELRQAIKDIKQIQEQMNRDASPKQD